jgi:hypothetical protein
MKIKTQDLIGSALRFTVAKIEKVSLTNAGWDYLHRKYGTHCVLSIPGGIPYEPDLDWAQGGPIIEREHICLDKYDNSNFIAFKRKSACPTTGRIFIVVGLTPLIAAMRCYVASQLGDEVDIPEELT